ncbi:MAG: FG-GAP-like repeat-containing protein, partial [bacterium]
MEGREGPVHAARWRDLDQDGDLDLLQVNDFGATRGSTMIWQNRGPGRRFRDLAAAGGIGTLAYPMGSAQTDLDGDGLLDLLFTDLGFMRLFRGLRPGEWVDVGQTWGAELPRDPADASWSAVELDIDGDGMEEIYVSFGPILAINSSD